MQRQSQHTANMRRESHVCRDYYPNDWGSASQSMNEVVDPSHK